MNGRFCLALIGAAIFAAGGGAAVQMPPPPGGPPPGMPGGGPGPGARPLTVTPVTDAVFRVEGGIGNVGFIVGDKGVIVVDTTVATASGQALLAAIAKVTPKPVVAVILTHGDMDHIGGLGAFPAGIRVIAQENNARRMAAEVTEGQSRLPADHLPNHRVAARETMTIEGVQIELLHWAPAHTDGDLVVFLPARKVAFTGDIFSLDQPRALIHREQGGTSAGWVESARGIVALDADRFVVGHGAVQAKPALAARIELNVAERERIKALVAAGKSLPEIQAEVGDPPPAGQPGFGPRFASFSEVVYQEVAAAK